MYDEKLLGTVAFSNGCLCSKKLTQREHRHFHPGGNLCPSKDDINVTRTLLELGNMLEIKLLDHIIVAAGGEFVSFGEKELL